MKKLERHFKVGVDYFVFSIKRATLGLRSESEKGNVCFSLNPFAIGLHSGLALPVLGSYVLILTQTGPHTSQATSG